MREFKRQRGFLVFAQNSTDDYVRMAYALALSLKKTQTLVPHLSVIISPGSTVPDAYREVFDEVIDVPWVDEARESSWKLENEWKAYHVTPYRETIKLDADMLFTTDVSRWWPLLETQEVMACTKVSTYRGQEITSDYYRKVFTDNQLPNVYTACMYFRYSDLAEELFRTAELIYHNWDTMVDKYLFENRPKELSTDVVFALAMKLMDEVDACTAAAPIPSFVHMKTRLQGWPEGSATEEWTQHIGVTLTNDLQLKIGRHRQLLPFHYHQKKFLTDEMISILEKA